MNSLSRYGLTSSETSYWKGRFSTYRSSLLSHITYTCNRSREHVRKQSHFSKWFYNSRLSIIYTSTAPVRAEYI
jgi:hypothetical protein